MLPVLIYVHDLSATGVVRNALALAHHLAAERPTILICGRAVGPLAEQARDLDVIDLGGHDLTAITRFRRHARRIAPAVAISAGNRGHPWFFAALVGLPGLRRVYRFSNDIDHRDSSGRRAWWKPLADGLQLALLRGSADHIVTVSPALASDIRLARVGVTAIPNGVDVSAIRAASQAPIEHAWFKDGGPPVVMGIGRLTRQKDFGTLLAAMSLVRHRQPARLLILGDGPFRSELHAQAQQLGLGPDALDMPGVLPNPHPLLVRAACFALPSLWEGASNALLEAIALDVPCIASATAGNAADVLGSGDYGVVVAPGDPPALAQAILRQVGPQPVRPAGRAAAFDRAAGLAAWSRLVTSEAAMLAPPPPMP